jgi:hypothetical protein
MTSPAVFAVNAVQLAPAMSMFQAAQTPQQRFLQVLTRGVTGKIRFVEKSVPGVRDLVITVSGWAGTTVSRWMTLVDCSWWACVKAPATPFNRRKPLTRSR